MNDSKDNSPDLLQQAWKEHLSESRITVNAELLQQEVQIDRDSFQSVIKNRDLGEISGSLLLIPVFLIMAAILPLPWTWYLSIPTLIGVPAFMLWHRRKNSRPEQTDETLVESVRHSIADLEDQIWLLRNVLWWYLLPYGLPIVIFFAHVSWQCRTLDPLFAILFFVLLAGSTVTMYAFIYWMNQAAVRNSLVPKRNALAGVLATLTDETESGGADEGKVSLSVASVASLSETKSEPASKFSLVRMIIGLSLFLLIMWGLIEFMSYAKNHPEMFRDSPTTTRSLHDKRSPFEAVRWNELDPEVKLDNSWHQLVAINDTPAEAIVEFAHKEYGDDLRKRFEEDLVEVMTEMDCPPGATVKLELRPLNSSKNIVRPGEPMTSEKRQRIYRANIERQQQEIQF